MIGQFGKSRGRVALLLMALAAVLFNLPLQNHTQPNISYAQDPLQVAACDTLVQDALQLVASRCLDLGKNEICYGNNAISATLSDDGFVFATPGDIVPVTAIETLITRPINPEDNEWGVALMNVQADLPDAEDSVQILLFGGAELTPTFNDQLVANIQPCSFENTSGNNLNLRAGPGENYAIVDVLDEGDTLPIYGKSTNEEWVRSSRGWVYAENGTTHCPTDNNLRLIENVEDAYHAPMQSFALRVDEDARCEAIPSGLLIQTPTGKTANLLINNVELRIGSTAVIQVDASGNCQTYQSLSGHVEVTTFGVVLPVGSEVTVPINPDSSDCYQAGAVAVGPVIQPIDESVPIFVEQVTTTLADPQDSTNSLDPVPAPSTWTPVAPIINFNAAVNALVAGECTVLNWAVANAQAATLDNVPIPAAGSQAICPTVTTTYTLNATALAITLQNASATVEIRVTPPVNNGNVGPTPTIRPDTDQDGVLDEVDNCVAVANPGQLDTDGDRLGDACDTDDDNDGFLDAVDNCPRIMGNALGCPDRDGDGVRDELDNCPAVANLPQLDLDHDGQGDACDTDDDGDTIADSADNCPLLPNAGQLDLDRDGLGDPCDVDDDGDTIFDNVDNCPFTPNTLQGDKDGDGLGNECDPDLDGDGFDNPSDACPAQPGPAQGCPDRDGDGIRDNLDNCPLIPNADQRDSDNDGLGDACDPLAADVGVTITVNNSTPLLNETVIFSVRVTNFGPNAADVHLALTRTNVAAAGGNNTQTIPIVIGTLAPNETRNHDLTYTTVLGFGHIVGVQIVPPTAPADPNPGNNQASVQIPIIN